MSYLTYAIKKSILGCPGGSPVTGLQVAGLIAVPSILVDVSLVTGRVLRHVHAVAIVITAARRNVVLGERAESREQRVQAATVNDAVRASSTRVGHVPRVRERARVVLAGAQVWPESRTSRRDGALIRARSPRQLRGKEQTKAKVPRRTQPLVTERER